MRSLVTGSSGVLGHSLVPLLGGDELRLFDLLPPPPTLLSRVDAAGIERDGIREIQGDMRDLPALEKAFDGVEVVYHLAAGQRMKPQFQALSEEEIFSMNLAGVENVLAAARSRRVRKVVFISSSAVYGLPEDRLVDEKEHSQEPLGAYGESKKEAEVACMRAVADGLDVTLLRPMSLFGEGMTGVFVLLFDWVRRNRRVFLLGRGANRVQMVSADDVADAALKAASAPDSAGLVVNIGSDPASVPTVHEQVEALIAHAGASSKVTTIPASLLRNAARFLNLFGLSPIVPEHYLLADRNFVLDIEEARSRLGWEPRSDNIRMTCDAYDWYCEHWREVAPKPHPALRILEALT